MLLPPFFYSAPGQLQWPRWGLGTPRFYLDSRGPAGLQGCCSALPEARGPLPTPILQPAGERASGCSLQSPDPRPRENLHLSSSGSTYHKGSLRALNEKILRKCLAPTPGMEPTCVNPNCTVGFTVTSPACVILWRGAPWRGAGPTCGAAPGGWGGQVCLRTQVPGRGHSPPLEQECGDFLWNARAAKLPHPQVRPHAPPAGLVGVRPRGPIRVDGGKGTAPLQEYRRTILYGKRHVPMTLAASRETGFHLEISERLKQTRAAAERGGVFCFPSAWGRPGGRAAGAVHGSEGPIRCPQQGNVAFAE